MSVTAHRSADDVDDSLIECHLARVRRWRENIERVDRAAAGSVEFIELRVALLTVLGVAKALGNADATDTARARDLVNAAMTFANVADLTELRGA